MTLSENTVIFVERAEHAGDLKLRLTFSDGTQQIVDFGPFLRQSHNPLIQAYRNPAAFARFAVRDGDLIWDDYDLITKLDRDDIEQARRMTGSQKLRAGGDLFDDACRWTLAGIRADHPGISDADALNELRRRVAMEDAEETPEAGET
jgi:hypothetical protein